MTAVVHGTRNGDCFNHRDPKQGRKGSVSGHVSASGATGDDKRSGYALGPRETLMMRLPWIDSSSGRSNLRFNEQLLWTITLPAQTDRNISGESKCAADQIPVLYGNNLRLCKFVLNGKNLL